MKGIKDPKSGQNTKKKFPKRTKGKKRERNKEPWRPPKIRKRIKKERGGSTNILYSTFVLQSSTYTSVCREFSCCTCITKWGSLHYRTWLAYSKDEPPQKSSRSS